MFTVAALLNAAYYGVRVYFRVLILISAPRWMTCPEVDVVRSSAYPQRSWGLDGGSGLKRPYIAAVIRPGMGRWCSSGRSALSGTKLCIRGTVDTAEMTTFSSTIPLTGPIMRNQLRPALAKIL